MATPNTKPMPESMPVPINAYRYCTTKSYPLVGDEDAPYPNIGMAKYCVDISTLTMAFLKKVLDPLFSNVVTV